MRSFPWCKRDKEGMNQSSDGQAVTIATKQGNAK